VEFDLPKDTKAQHTCPDCGKPFVYGQVTVMGTEGKFVHWACYMDREEESE
jgi:hypothetical protein